MHINYNRFIDSWAVRNFVDTCAPSASRWRSLRLVSEWNGSGDEATMDQNLRALMGHHVLVLPRLYELSIEESSFDEPGVPIWNSSENEPAGTRPWEAPNLHILRCTQYIPPLSFPFNSFTSFTLSLTLLPDDIVYQIGDLFDFLFSKPNISTIVLELVSSRGANSQFEEEIDMDATVCPSVTSFHLKVSRFGFPHAARQIFVRMFEVLQMPNLQSFHLSLDQHGLDPSVISKLLPNPNGHPLLSSLTVEVQLPVFFNLNMATSETVGIPLERIPHVSSLRVTTFGTVSFSS